MQSLNLIDVYLSSNVGDFSQIYNQTKNVTRIEYSTIEADDISPLYELANYITQSNKEMTIVLMD